MNLTLADLQNEELFPRQTTMVTIQCSGTRRIEQILEYAGEGDELINAPWAEGAIGNARWTGVSLKKVIKHCGGLIDDAKHLEFYGADTYFKQVIDKIFDLFTCLTQFIGPSDELRCFSSLVESEN